MVKDRLNISREKIMVNLEKQLPHRLVDVRPMKRDDVQNLAEWIKRGRQENVFKPGLPLDGSSILRYQEKIRSTGWNHECKIAESSGKPIGYLDYRFRGRKAQLLGIFIEPQFRHLRIGRHLLRWAVAYLREHGCLEITAEVYAENEPSLRACFHAGFRHDGLPDRIENGKRVRVLRRWVQHFDSLVANNHLYTSLRGVNVFLHHVALAEVIAKELSNLPGVKIILGLGSIARGFADGWSDLDLAVIGSGKSLARLWRGERWFSGTSVDLFVVDSKASPLERWDDSRLQAFEESVVLFSRDDRLLNRLRNRVHLSASERDIRLREKLFKIGWLGFQPRGWYNKRKYGYVWSLPHDLWIKRGNTASAHATVDQALDLSLQLLFLLNGRRVPDPKWRRYLVTGLEWLPGNFKSILRKAEGAKRDRRSFTARADAVLQIVEKTVQRLQKTRLLSGDVYKSYLFTSNDYDPEA